MKLLTALLCLGLILGVGIGLLIKRARISRRIELKEYVSGQKLPPITYPTAQEPPTSLRAERFLWGSVESDNITELFSNLRAAGCPEKTIRDIVGARIIFMYRGRIRKLENPMFIYWASSEEVKNHEMQVSAILAERDALLASLGIELPQNPFVPAQILSKTSQLPPEKQKAVVDITAMYPNQLLSINATAEEKQARFRNRRARLDYLSTVLTPEELFNYRLEQDSNAKALANILRPINLTDGEFERVAFILDFSEINLIGGRLQPEFEKALREALGEQRYLEYLTAFAPNNALFNRFLMMDHTTQAEIAELRNIRQRRLSGNELQAALTSVIGSRRAIDYLRVVQPAPPQINQ
jgi:hypothetical protein